MMPQFSLRAWVAQVILAAMTISSVTNAQPELSRFTGTINKLTFNLGKEQLTAELRSIAKVLGSCALLHALLSAC
jgi:hypothetical protein